jgi:dTDP-4-dehydrorhamnose 3,5-epimerase
VGELKATATAIAGLYEIDSAAVGDARGKFLRLFCERELASARPNLHFAQINLSETRERGSVRGMHYQKPPAAEAKLVRCLRGRIFDVAVDLRSGSPTFLRWHGVELSADNDRALFIPEGLAHGFQTLTDDVQMLYLHTMPWTPDREGGVRYDDPRLDIRWPLPVAIVSDKDRAHPLIDSTFSGLAP